MSNTLETLYYNFQIDVHQNGYNSQLQNTILWVEKHIIGLHSLLFWDVRFGPKVGHICPKWVKSGTFSDQTSVHFSALTQGPNLISLWLVEFFSKNFLERKAWTWIIWGKVKRSEQQQISGGWDFYKKQFSIKQWMIAWNVDFPIARTFFAKP